MRYRGYIQNGVVVLEDAPPLTNGTEVEVVTIDDAPAPDRGSAAAILRHTGTWVGEPGEMDRLLEELKRDKWAEVEAELRRAEDALPL